MSATMPTHTSGIDLAARRATAERLWRQHGGTLRQWTNPAGYTILASAYDSAGHLAGELTIRTDAVIYSTRTGAASPQERAAVRAVRDALIGGR